MRQPWEKWYPQDWLGDPCLARCSPATRGIWADALMSMLAASDLTGELSATVEELCRVCRCSVTEMLTALRELHESDTAEIVCHADVTLMSRTVNVDDPCIRHASVTLMSRRLQRKANKRSGTRLRKQRQRCHTDVTLQKPEARSYASRQERMSRAVTPAENDDPPAAGMPLAIESGKGPASTWGSVRQAFPCLDIKAISLGSIERMAAEHGRTIDVAAAYAIEVCEDVIAGRSDARIPVRVAGARIRDGDGLRNGTLARVRQAMGLPAIEPDAKAAAKSAKRIMWGVCPACGTSQTTRMERQGVTRCMSCQADVAMEPA